MGIRLLLDLGGMFAKYIYELTFILRILGLNMETRTVTGVEGNDSLTWQ